jgi:ankyrin repeat protein
VVFTGFPIDAEDAKGNTLLLVAAQNCNRRMVEMLLARGASINHRNSQGNTALHFAIVYDPEGLLGMRSYLASAAC